MLLHSRRFTIWLVSFLAVLVMYLVYNRMSRTPHLTEQYSYTGIADVCDSNGRIGMVGDVGVGTAKNVRYNLLDANKQIEGEFGFEELLHQDGNDWELEKPYYRMYRRGFRCEIKGDRAKVVVETAGNRVTPKRGKLTGNVTIHIWPQRAGGFSEGKILLDDVVFVGEKSMFSTSGLVEYVSRDAHLVGKGMELIYNNDEDRLEFLKIAKLESLHINRWSREAGTAYNRTQAANEPAPEEKDTSGSRPGHKYKCVLDRNVTIETPQERLRTELLSINDIVTSNESKDESSGQATEDSTGPVTNTPAVAPAQAQSEVAINCDGSVLILPMDSTMELKQPPPTETQEAATPADEKTTFYGRRIDYNASTGVVVATGESKVTFDVNDTGREASKGPAKVTITAQKQTKFEPASNKVSFEGDCRCVATQEDVNYLRQYFVLADSLEADLTRQDNDQAKTSPAIKRFVATGGVVHLASTKKAGNRLLTGVELKCTRIDYDAVADKFVAAGPGLIMIDNSQTDEPQKGLGRFSLRRKSYAFLRNFDSLEFDKGNNHLVAYSKNCSMLADFIPVGENQEKDKVAVTASRIEADIIETTEGRTELGALVAKGAVTYEDKDIQCAGSEFVYDNDGPAISIRGNRSRPCIFNGAIVDSAWRNPKTGKWRTRLKAPGAIK